jgi:hypothetical protein
VDDTVVTSTVKSALLGDPAINSFDLQLEIRNGEVQLTGFGNNQRQIDLATQITGATEGATNVKNELMVMQCPPTPPESTMTTTDKLTTVRAPRSQARKLIGQGAVTPATAPTAPRF